jgi:ribosome-binding factor A
VKAKRVDRLASQLVREIADILRREISDPRLGWVTITRAEVSPDMHEARVFVRTLDDGEKLEEVLTALRHAAGYIRKELGQRLEWRILPELHFQADTAAEQTEKVLRLIEEVSRERRSADGGTET